MIALFAWIWQKISKKVGRIELAVTSTICGISLLVLMSFRNLWQFKALIIIVFLLRTSLMNAPMPLVRSILMDYTSSKSRAKWSSLESLTSFGWSGSAVVGGILADRVGYGYTFLITASMQFLSVLLLSLVLPLVHNKKGIEKEKPDPLFTSYAPLLEEEEDDG
jgi:predicted MFS family arabinose efflux permease